MTEKIVLSDAAKEARRKYTHAYRQKNKDKVKKWNAEYWERRAKREAEGNESERLQND